MTAKRVLIVVGGQFHPFAACADILRGVLERTGGFRVEISEDRERFTALRGYDALILHTQGGELSPAQERGLLEFVRGGGGLLGLHAATTSFRSSAAYLEMIGAEFQGHGHAAEITVELAEDVHDVLPRVERKWVQPDEFYRLAMRAAEPVRVVQYGWWEGRREPLGWLRPYGAGRVAYTALGHDERAFRNAAFQNFCFKALRWVTGAAEKPLRWGIVGYGPAYGMGKHHAEFIRETPGLTLTAVCDRDPARVAAARGEQGEGLAYFTDVRELVAARVCDGATTIVPHNAHADVAVPLLEAGLHVISEKPFAITPADCDRMIAAARASGAILSVYHSRHWDTDMWTIRTLVEAGEIGEVFSIEHNMLGYGRPGQAWRSNKAVSGGLLYDMGAHGFEKVFQLVPRTEANRKALLFGNFLKRVWWDSTNEDYARAYVRFGSGLEALVTQSNICAVQKPGWVVCGTRGSCVTTNDGVELRQYVNGSIRVTHVPYVRDLTWRSYYWNFADHALTGAPLIITPGLARATIQCVHGCEQASREGRALEVSFDF